MCYKNIILRQRTRARDGPFKVHFLVMPNVTAYVTEKMAPAIRSSAKRKFLPPSDQKPASRFPLWIEPGTIFLSSPIVFQPLALGVLTRPSQHTGSETLLRQ